MTTLIRGDDTVESDNAVETTRLLADGWARQDGFDPITRQKPIAPGDLTVDELRALLGDKAPAGAKKAELVALAEPAAEPTT